MAVKALRPQSVSLRYHVYHAIPLTDFFCLILYVFPMVRRFFINTVYFMWVAVLCQSLEPLVYKPFSQA